MVLPHLWAGCVVCMTVSICRGVCITSTNLLSRIIVSTTICLLDSPHLQRETQIKL